MERDEQDTCKPQGHSNGIAGVKEFFTLWIIQLENLVQERFKRIDDRFEERAKNIDEKFLHIEESRKIAADALEKRLYSLNEIRNSLRDQSDTFFTKAAHEIFCDKIELEITSLEKEIRSLEDFKLTLDTKASTKQMAWAYILSGASLFLVIVDILTRIIFK